MLPGSFVEKIKKKYKKIIVLFDNDDAGIKSMAAYKSKHGLDYIRFELEKDLSDAVKAHGVEKVKKQLSKLINMNLYGL
jgi:DNA primase